jgi:hypothetical protein
VSPVSNHPVSDADLLQAVSRFRDLIRTWHVSPCTMATTSSLDVGAVTRALHATNFALWHAEDDARRCGAVDREVAGAKRRIDELNVRRNASIETLDTLLLTLVVPDRDREPLLHTETPATIVDRLSVLALRIVHAQDAAWCAERVAVLDEQYRDLSRGLETYLGRIAAGQLAFKVYRQFKSDGRGYRCAAVAMPAV